MILPYATWVEIVQLLLALVGVGVTFWRLWIAFENGLLITATDSTDFRRIVAETQVLGEIFRLFVQGCLTSLGIISVLLPPPGIHPATADLDAPQEYLQAFLTRIGLITITVTLVADSVVQELRRQRFLAAVHDGEGAHAQGERLAGALAQKIEAGTAAAHAAYEEANSVNAKISALQRRLDADRTPPPTDTEVR